MGTGTGTGPVPATRGVPPRTGLGVQHLDLDPDLVEPNDAFAARACAVMQEPEPAKVNNPTAWAFHSATRWPHPRDDHQHRGDSRPV